MPGGAWRPDFLKLWSGQTISLFGSSVSELAFPLTAVLVLNVNPTQMGFMRAAQYAPFLLLGLLAGAWIDRRRRRPVLIWTDVGRAAVVASVPIAAALGLLTLEHLYLVAFLAGVLTVFFDVAYLAYLPSLVPRAALSEANGKLEVSRSLAQTAGPSVAGALIEVATAPIALAADAATFAVSALSIGLIRADEPTPATVLAPSTAHTPAPPGGLPSATSPEARGILQDVGEGLQIVRRHPVLRALAGQIFSLQLAGGINTTLFALFALRDLALTPATLGILASASSAIALIAALCLGRVVALLGERRTLVASLLLTGIGNVAIPLAGVLPHAAVPLLMARAIVHGCSGPAFNVASVSLRQIVTPDHLQGRVSATIRFVGWGVLPLSALAGGLLGERLGLLPALTIATCLSLTNFLWPLLVVPRQIVPLEIRRGSTAEPC